MFEECEINKNILSTMTSRWSIPQADSLAKIADYLGVSVDYLLGRTSEPNGYSNNQINMGDISGNHNANINVNQSKNSNEMTNELIKRFEELSFDEKLEVFNYLKNLK